MTKKFYSNFLFLLKKISGFHCTYSGCKCVVRHIMYLSIAYRILYIKKSISKKVDFPGLDSLPTICYNALNNKNIGMFVPILMKPFFKYFVLTLILYKKIKSYGISGSKLPNTYLLVN